jgi:phenolic acid decarboxylase
VLDDENHDHATTRYIYNNGWEYQYTINETPLTQAQLNALNSGITAGKVAKYDTLNTREFTLSGV